MEVSGLKFGLEAAAALAGVICIAFIVYVLVVSKKTG
jgi:hypothetical protein